MNKSRGTKNIIFGLLSQFITLSLGLIIPRLVLVNLGSESNGLLNAIGSVLSYMSLLEAGVGTASLQALYKPLALNDKKGISRIMAATHYFYRRTGTVYFVLVVFIALGFTALIETTIPRLDVFLVVFMSGMSGVLNYFFQGKFKILLAAEGKGYVTTNISTIIHVFVSLTKIAVLLAGGNVVAVQAVYFFYNLVQMLVFMLYMRRHYDWVDYKTDPDFEATSQKNAVLVHQISTLIFSNTDVLLLTIFTSLKEVSVYSMYAMIYGMVKSLAVILYESYTYALGQTYNSDRGRFMRMFNAYEMLTILISFSLYCICRALMNPFLTLYTAGVMDIAYVDKYLPWLFATYYLLHNGRTSSAVLINISQHFEDTKWRSVLESAINITVSVACVIRFGVYGVVMGTIAALLYRTNDMIIFASQILHRSCWVTYKRWLINIGIFLAVSLLIDNLPLKYGNYFELLLSAIVVGILVVGMFIIGNSVVERENTKYVINILKNGLHRIMKRQIS